MTNTKLAGWINKNPFLLGGAAKIIVNEVTSLRPTNIKGFLEVAGNKASVVIANPNGITVNGGGFINTGSALLTTGKSQYDGIGNLQDIRVSQGNVVVDGNGLNGREADSVSIYARAAEINAGLWADYLKVVTGSNSINMNTGEIVPIAAEGKKPEVSLDIASIGGMYAGVISLVGTEKGLGVNLKGTIAASQVLSIDTDGTLHVAGTGCSEGNTEIKADVVDNQGVITANKGLLVQGRKIENHEGGKLAGDVITLKSQSLNNLRNEEKEHHLQEEQRKLEEKQKELEDAYAQDVTVYTNDAQITAYEKDIKAATVNYDEQLAKVKEARRELEEHSAGIIQAEKSLNIEADAVRNSAGASMTSNNEINIQGKSVLNRGALILAEESVKIHADEIQNKNETFSMRREASELQKNPRRIRIDQGGHREQGKVFDAEEFQNLDSGYGASHKNVSGAIHDYTIIDSSSQTSEDKVTLNQPAKLAAGKDMTLQGNVQNDNSWLTATDTITIKGNFKQEGAQKQVRTVTFGTTQGSYTYKRKFPHKSRRRGYGAVTFMTPQIELSEPSGITMPDVEKAHEEIEKAIDPFQLKRVTAEYVPEKRQRYTDKKEVLSSEYMKKERLYDPQRIAGEIASVSDARHLDGVTGMVQAKNIYIVGDEIENNGAIVAENATMQGVNIQHHGVMTGNTLQLDAKGNLTITGKIDGDKRVSLSGRDVTIKSMVSQYKNQDTLNQIAAIGVEEENGELSIKAEKDIKIQGAALNSMGTTQLEAGKDITLVTQNLHSQKDMTVDSDNYLRTSRDKVLSTQIQAQGDIVIDAGQDMTADASYLGSQNGNITIRAGKGINLQAGKDKSHDQYSLQHKENGLLSRTKTLTRSDSEQENVVGTSLSGKNVMLDSTGSIQTEATQIAADQNIRFEAKEIKIDAAAQKNREQYEKQVTNAGLMTNGLGIMVGKQKRKDEDDDRYITQQGTAIATNGKVTIKASKQATITSSDIVAAEGIDISAPEVTINGRENIEEHMRRHEESKTGITVGLGGNSYRAIESVNRPIQRANNVKDDRLKGLYAWRAARELKKHGETLKNVAKGKLDIGVTIGVGSSHSESKTTTKSQEYVGSNIESQENVNLKATERDLSIIGSLVTGKDINLDAKENLKLQAGENRTHTEVVEKSQSGGLSIDYSLSGKTWGNGLNVNYGESELRGNGYQITYTGTEISAEGALNTKSGRDTTIIGSTASGNKVEMVVGGNLALETLQDIDNYQEQSHTKGFSSDIVNGFRPDIGINGSRGKIESEYQSTTEQTGIYAGKEGFQINTVGNTDLKGSVIASESAADKNKLSTGTLSWENVENKEEYKAKGIGFSYHKYGDFDKKTRAEKDELYKTIGLTPNLSMPAQGKAKNISKSAIAKGEIATRDKNQDINSLSRDTQNALSKLDKIFDKSTIQERQELARIFGEEAYRLSHNMKDDGSGRKIAVHAAIGGIMSQITGGGFTSGATGAGVNEAVIKELGKIKDPGTIQVLSGIIGAVTAKIVKAQSEAGAVTAISGTKNNFEAVLPELKSILSLVGCYLILENGKNIITDKVGNMIAEIQDDGEIVFEKGSEWLEDYLFEKNKDGLNNTTEFSNSSISESGSKDTEKSISFQDSLGHKWFIEPNYERAVPRDTSYLDFINRQNATIIQDVEDYKQKIVKYYEEQNKYLEADKAKRDKWLEAYNRENSEKWRRREDCGNNIIPKLPPISLKINEDGIIVFKITLGQALDLLNKDSVDNTKSKWRTINKEKTGGIEQANKDFDKLKLKDVKDIYTQDYGKGKVGKLDEGHNVTVREGSKTGGPTIEIQKGKKRYKYRYKK